MVKEFDVNSWEEFELQLQSLTVSWEKSGARAQPLQFRGQGDSSWHLLTTLERYGQESMLVDEYYRTVSYIRPQIETFTDARYEGFDYAKRSGLFSRYDEFSTELTFGNLPAYGYLAHLRHHGFPSPLLDWTRSPRIAAFFAFRNHSGASKVSIYALRESNMRAGSSNRARIHHFGPHVRTHRRHFLQQSTYTVCLSFEVEKGWAFSPHDGSWNTSGEDDDDLFLNFSLIKFNIPSSERTKVLNLLDLNNLNSFSLFGSEESLLETISFRELLPKSDDADRRSD